ncbi:MAG: polysaccharide deacetylase family protein [Proteobacteria bacterium]|nr:polysaccharide deacetylase family protein [Pseudomonadota bacterium]
MSKELFLTIDLEDFRYFKSKELGLSVRSGAYYVEKGLDNLLKALALIPGNQKLTFFTTAQIARDQKSIIQKLVKSGHEIGCHTFEHENLLNITKDQFRKILHRSTKILEDTVGAKISGFRAPSFAVSWKNGWFYDLLSEAGYCYDSSFLIPCDKNPVKSSPIVFSTSAGKIFEYPVMRYRPIPGVSIRIIGGTYFRLLPLNIIDSLLDKVYQLGYIPIIWLHPTDFCHGFKPFSFKDISEVSILNSLKYPLDMLLLQSGVDGVPDKLKKIAEKWQMKGRIIDHVEETMESLNETKSQQRGNS